MPADTLEFEEPIAVLLKEIEALSLLPQTDAREREIEFSLLHALGLKSGQLARWLLLEQAALVAVALGLGLAVGIGIAEFLLPLVTLNQDGSKAVPELLVIHDWSSIWGFQLALLVTLGVVLGAVIAMVTRRGTASSLRFGDEE